METASTLSVSPPWGSGEKKYARSALNSGLERKQSQFWLQTPRGLLIHFTPFTTQLPHDWVNPLGQESPRGHHGGQGWDPETHRVISWKPSVQGKPSALLLVEWACHRDAKVSLVAWKPSVKSSQDPLASATGGYKPCFLQVVIDQQLPVQVEPATPSAFLPVAQALPPNGPTTILLVLHVQYLSL